MCSRPRACCLPVLLALLALQGAACQETHELFPAAAPPEREPDASVSGPEQDAGSNAPGTLFQLISIGANAQTDGLGELNGLGAAIIVRDDELVFWGNGGEQTNGRGIAVAVVDPEDGSLQGPAENFDTWETRNTGGAETARLVAFLEQVAPGMLVLLAVGDDAGLTDNGLPGVLCNLLEDDPTQQLLQALSQLGSRRIHEYCYRASWVMAAYKGKGVAEREVLTNGAPALASVRVPSQR